MNTHNQLVNGTQGRNLSVSGRTFYRILDGKEILRTGISDHRTARQHLHETHKNEGRSNAKIESYKAD